jgi:hypothetical protein
MIFQSYFYRKKEGKKERKKMNKDKAKKDRKMRKK